jgi:ribonuclease BN (tRNA processing enzyme)
VLKGQQQYPNFPVVWDDMPCSKNYMELNRLHAVPFKIGELTVKYQELTHPDSVFSYRFEVNGKSFVCATDTEHKDVPDPRLVQLSRDADVLYYDSHYTPEEYIGTPGSLTGAMPKFDWGHSTYEWAILNALAANVKTIVLGHHEPLRDDFGMEELKGRALTFKDRQLQLPENAGKKLDVVAGYQGLEQKL